MLLFEKRCHLKKKFFNAGSLGSVVGPDSFDGAITKVFNEILADLKIICDLHFPRGHTFDQISEKSLQFYIISVLRQ